MMAFFGIPLPLACIVVLATTSVLCQDVKEQDGKLWRSEQKVWKAIAEMASKQNAELKALIQEYQNNEKIIDSLTTINKEKRQADPKIAFSTTLNHPSTHYQAHQVFLFDNIKTNFGGYYDPTSGKFSAPFSGLYHFSVTIGSKGGSGANVDAEIVQNGAPKVRVHATTHGHDMGHQSIVLNLTEGDSVWVRHRLHAGDSGAVNDGISTFSGHLIAKIL